MFTKFSPILAAPVLALALGLSSGGALASEGVKLSDAAKAQIREKLVAEGYEVGKIKTDDGLYEAYAKKDGRRYEIYLDAQMNIVRTKED